MIKLGVAGVVIAKLCVILLLYLLIRFIIT